MRRCARNEFMRQNTCGCTTKQQCFKRRDFRFITNCKRFLIYIGIEFVILASENIHIIVYRFAVTNTSSGFVRNRTRIEFIIDKRMYYTLTRY